MTLDEDPKQGFFDRVEHCPVTRAYELQFQLNIIIDQRKNIRLRMTKFRA